MQENDLLGSSSNENSFIIIIKKGIDRESTTSHGFNQSGFRFRIRIHNDITKFSVQASAIFWFLFFSRTKAIRVCTVRRKYNRREITRQVNQ